MSRLLLTLPLLCVALALPLGCAPSMGSVRTIPSTRKIALPKALTANTTRGVGVKWVEGLSAGTYTEEAENEEGTFFRGPKDCVILLGGSLAEEYLKTGVPPSHEQKLKQGMYLGEDGGVWIPKPGVERRARFYYYFQPPRASGSGALIGAMIETERGERKWGPEVEDQRILDVFAASKR